MIDSHAHIADGARIGQRTHIGRGAMVDHDAIVGTQSDDRESHRYRSWRRDRQESPGCRRSRRGSQARIGSQRTNRQSGKGAERKAGGSQQELFEVVTPPPSGTLQPLLTAALARSVHAAVGIAKGTWGRRDLNAVCRFLDPPHEFLDCRTGF